jgi:hypothetical protein
MVQALVLKWLKTKAAKRFFLFLAEKFVKNTDNNIDDVVLEGLKKALDNRPHDLNRAK